MKKIILLFFLVISSSFSLEISSIDPLNFGKVIVGDKNVSLSDVGVYVEGKSGKNVEIIVPKLYNFAGNNMSIRPREQTIRLNEDGRGRFKLDVNLKLNNTKEYQTLTDRLSIKVRYVN